MGKTIIIGIVVWLTIDMESRAQHYPDSAFIWTDQIPTTVIPAKPAKISHAEPLYLDLVRDLGARKGEREWNVGTEFTKQNDVTRWHPFVEYEFAPINRLGLEVEFPFQLTVPAPESARTARLQLHSVKTSIQWTYAVLTRLQTSLAVGYTNELLINATSVRKENTSGFLEQGHPFLVVAKRWGRHFHSLLYVSLAGEATKRGTLQTQGSEVNVALHYIFPNSKVFVGVEIYQFRQGILVEQVARPQFRIPLTNNCFVGLIGSIPLNHLGERSAFLRLVYEPRRTKN